MTDISIMKAEQSQSSRLASLLEIEEIRQLRVMYSHHLDSGQIDRMDEIFAPDGTLSVTVGSMNGIDEIKAGLNDGFRQFDRDGRGRYPFFHPVMNHEVRLTGPNTAEGKCYLVDFETASKVDPDPLLLLGLYHDTYRKVSGSWRIATSRLDVVWPHE
ncbi:hypothetical protein J2S28_005732 [Rhizobium sp. SLBN-94]|nr:hypothetical protein [Rhizobium sp. SLBN-94]